jgi:hypothetical protein
MTVRSLSARVARLEARAVPMIVTPGPPPLDLDDKWLGRYVDVLVRARLCGVPAIEHLEATAAEAEGTDPRRAADLRNRATWMRWIRRIVLRADPDAAHDLDARPTYDDRAARLTIGEPDDGPVPRPRYLRGWTSAGDLVIGEDEDPPARAPRW